LYSSSPGALTWQFCGFVGPHVFIRIPGDRVVFAVELARPLVVRGFAVAAGAIDRDFDVVACGLVYNRAVFRRSWAEL